MVLTRESLPIHQLARELDASVEQHAVILISADYPGCGSSSLARELAELLGGEAISIGEQIRQYYAIEGEADLHTYLPDIHRALGEEFDQQIYESLPTDRVMVVEGKYATQLGPKFLGDRPHYSIQLTAPELVTAVRILRREKHSLSELIEKPELILTFLERVQSRSAFLRSQRDSSIDIERYDTGQHTASELAEVLAASFLGLEEQPHEQAREAEVRGLIETLSLIEDSLRTLKWVKGKQLKAADKEHLDENVGRIQYQLDLLATQCNAAGLQGTREKIRSYLSHAVFSLFIRLAPRFYRDMEEGKRIIDEQSVEWSPEYYKLMRAWPTLSTMLKDKTILDPFAGSGSLMNVLAARGLARQVVCGDISYLGGYPVHRADSGTTFYYDPEFNTQMIQAIFDQVPSWYKPIHLTDTFVTLDATQLPFATNSFDLIVTDPPYGKNCHTGGWELVERAIPELLRVAREGVICIVPEEWMGRLQEIVPHCKQLTHDLSLSASHYPTVLVHLQKGE